VTTAGGALPADGVDGVIEVFVNVNLANLPRPPWLEQVAERYFKGSGDIFRNLSLSE
jgi:hypothetical protein